MASFAKPPCDEAVMCARPCETDAVENGPWILAATILGSSMAFIDGTVVNVALPALQAALHANLAGVQWVVESYGLPLAAFLLLGGSLGDEYGRRKLFVFGVFLFAAASAWCGLARGIAELIVARSAQGTGAALLVPGSLALIGANFPEQERGRAIGTWSGFTAITAAIGPVLGGWFVQHGSWRWVFFINVPVGVAVLILTLWKVPQSRTSSPGRVFDWWGAGWATLGLGGVSFGLIESSRPADIAGVIALLGFLYCEARSSSPMVPLHLFRSQNFAWSNILTLFLYAALSGVLFFVPLDLIQVQGYSPTEAGAALLPIILLMFLLSRWSGGLVDRYGARLPLVAGSLVSAGGFALFALPAIGGWYWTTFFPPALALGLGMAICVAPLTTTVMDAVDRSYAGTASGINNATSRIASVLAIAVFGALLSVVFESTLDGRLRSLHVAPPIRAQIEAQQSRLAAARTDNAAGERAIKEAFVAGFQRVLWASSGLALASAAAAALIKDPGRG